MLCSIKQSAYLCNAVTVLPPPNVSILDEINKFNKATK